MFFHRATPDLAWGASDFMVSPYDYGMHFEYQGIAEWTVKQFSIQHNPAGGSLLIGNGADSAGLMLSVLGNTGYAEIAHQGYDGSPAGDIHVRFPASTNALIVTQGPPGDITQQPLVSLGANGVITAVNSVGVGTVFGVDSPEPLAPLHVQTTIDAPATIRLELQNMVHWQLTIPPYSADLTIQEQDGEMTPVTIKDGTPTDTIVTTSTGVGIGTDAPTQKLEVVGNIQASGSLMLGTNELSFSGNILYWNGKQVKVGP
jgi:hypothetical protein